jgi:hypothetical protein
MRQRSEVKIVSSCGATGPVRSDMHMKHALLAMARLHWILRRLRALGHREIQRRARAAHTRLACPAPTADADM